MLAEPEKTRYDLRFPIGDFPVCVHPFFWLIAAVLGWSDDTGLLEIIIWIFCVFVSILVHELGHALAARYFGVKDVRIVLHGMGGQTIFNANIKPIERIIELSCGPLAGFLLSGLVLLFSKFFDPVFNNALLQSTSAQLISINLVWGLLNLIPVLPLDGGQIMCELIKRKRPWDGTDIAIKTSIAVSILVTGIFALFAIIALFRGTESNWFPAIVFAFLGVINYQMYKSNYAYGENQREREIRSPWERDPDWWKS